MLSPVLTNRQLICHSMWVKMWRAGFCGLHRKNRKTKWLEQLRGCLLCLLLGECSFDRRDFPKTGEQSAVRSAVQLRVKVPSAVRQKGWAKRVRC